MAGKKSNLYFQLGLLFYVTDQFKIYPFRKKKKTASLFPKKRRKSCASLRTSKLTRQIQKKLREKKINTCFLCAGRLVLVLN